MSFLPTDYKGVSELGLLAGLGMIVAFLTSVTVIPALLTVLNPPGEPKEMGYKSLAPVDRFMERHRIGDHRRHRDRGRGRAAAALLAAVRFQSAQPAQPEGRVGRDLPRSAQRSCDRRQLDLHARAEQGSGARRRREAVQAARGRGRQDDRELHSDRPGAQARGDPPARRQSSNPVLKPDPSKTPPTDADNVAALKAAVDQPAAGGRQCARQAGTRRGRGAAPGRRARQGRRRRRGAARARAGGHDPAARRPRSTNCATICRRSR